MLEFYVGCQYLAGVLTRRRASRLMSRFAGEALTAALPDGAPVAVYALGKFGERELNYRSDLDIVVFHEGDYEASRELVEKLVDDLRMEFKVDLRLRPEGKKGSLVWDLESTAAYLRSRAEVWERMAWTKIRFVAGNRSLAARFAPLIDEFVYARPFGGRQIGNIRRIRERMEKELAREGPGAWDLKLGRGGLVDVEFLAEFLQIRNRIRIPNTAVTLKRSGMAVCVEDYMFLRELESMLRLSNSLATSRIEEKDIRVLEAMLDIDDFKERYAAVTNRIRTAFDAYAGPGSTRVS